MPDPGSPWERENPKDGLGYLKQEPTMDVEKVDLIERAEALADRLDWIGGKSRDTAALIRELIAQVKAGVEISHKPTNSA